MAFRYFQLVGVKLINYWIKYVFSRFLPIFAPYKINYY